MSSLLLKRNSRGLLPCNALGLAVRNDNIDIEAVFKANKDPLPAGPRMVGLKRGSEDDEEKKKCTGKGRLC